MLVSKIKPCKSEYKVSENCEWLFKTAIASARIKLNG